MTKATRPFVKGLTVDSPTSRDLDDAIWVKRGKKGWSVIISITDVAAIIKKGDRFDNEAFKRAFTQYFAAGNHPMLTRELSDVKLSLLPNQVRKTISFFLKLDSNLNVSKLEIKRTRLKSKRKMTHQEVDRLLDETGDKQHQLWIDYFELAQGLLQKRREMGALAVFDLSKGLMTDEEGVVTRIPDGKYYRAYLIVQELMILCNHTVTAHLLKEGVSLLVRNHCTRKKEVHESYLSQISELLLEATPEVM